ncbi:hypothetical protein BASA50_003112 [Batrachochytrium salamandrivorans]|uniref:hydroxyacylglutathione hydrolase n=1 Tax=Batrachochytrium salamandrivorans TaxID=1357716 RepID=A0ABQ8FJN8_9FUNG|nr:hypothetical protein BASA60_004120 [Batrachochytrium salamandrivorans]KAH6599324.1 hypothetical protein BASA50_003112 [Batrachochytrium salamandrivorans]KAH9252523.1 hypothetical protein BASA81_009566 [Batrachochytrium salamandrivorans]KAH9270964.1 hypothetical protein BASA83_006920 [Batrachochytrium salamandrivorans]
MSVYGSLVWRSWSRVWGLRTTSTSPWSWTGTALSLIPISLVAAPLLWSLALSSSQRTAFLHSLFTDTALGYYYARSLEPAMTTALSSPHRNVYMRKPLITGPLEVVMLPCLKDNYAYLIVDSEQGTAIIIDPSDPNPVLQELSRRSLKPIAILNTHHHWDHCSGNARLVKMFSGLPVYGSTIDFAGASLSKTLKHTTHFVEEGDELHLGRAVLRVMLTPCHTRGSILLMLDSAASLGTAAPVASHSSRSPSVTDSSRSPSVTDSSRMDSLECMEGFGSIPTTLAPPHSTTAQDLDTDNDLSANNVPTTWDPNAACLFTGDTIMTAGCGRFFEAKSPHDMHLISARLLAQIPANTHVFPGHEYALTNLAFAALLEPSNIALASKYQQAIEAARLRLPMVPSTWQEEMWFNPFLRLDTRYRRDELWRNTMVQASLLCAEGSRLPIADAIRRDALPYCANLGITGSAVDEVVAMGCLRALKDRFRMENGQGKL